jgi:predicted ferric reductase
MKQKRFFWVLFYIVAAILPSIFYISDSINNKSDFLFILAGFFGITSYALFAFQFLLVSRPKIIDEQFGLDRIYRFHMVIAVVALLFAFIHKTLKGIYFSHSFQTSLGDDAFFVFVAISVFSILMMINKLFFKVKPIDEIRKFLNKTLKIKYQYKVLIHNITLVGLIILLVHILLAYSVSSNLPLKITLIAYFIIPFGLYLNRKIIKVYFNKNKRYSVSEIINESDSITTIKFRPKYGKLFNYQPGQFLYVRINNPEIPRDEHPFTISSSPSQTDYVSVTVKQLGDFTNSLNKLNVGDNACIDGAFGTFSYLKKHADRKICFIAGGIGITPFLGMLRYMNSVDNGRDVVLLWGARDLSEVICKNELDEYTAKFKNFKFVPVISNDDNYNGERGFIDTKLIKKYTDNLLEYDFYLCGPPIMMEIQLKNLKNLGIQKNNIYFERFAI